MSYIETVIGRGRNRHRAGEISLALCDGRVDFVDCPGRFAAGLPELERQPDAWGVATDNKVTWYTVLAAVSCCCGD